MRGARRGPMIRFVASSAENRDGLFSVRQVAHQLGVHPETIRRLIHDGRLEAVRVGRVLRVDPVAVQGFLDRQRVKPSLLVAPDVESHAYTQPHIQ
jgi:excisionase family DNA binding protein